MTDRIRVEAHGPRGPLNVYHPDVPESPIEIPVAQPPHGVFADPQWVLLARNIAGVLYVVVERGRHRQPPLDAGEAAQHHLCVATGAVCATEIETLAALCDLGLHRSAQVHARAVGILARNALVFSTNAELATLCYDSLEVSRKELIDRARGQLADVAGLWEVLEQRFEDAVGDSMLELEKKHGDLFRKHREYMMSPFFQNYWSKWAHGDIVALAEAGDGLGTATDVRSALNVTADQALSVLALSVRYALVCYGVLCDLGIGSAAKWQELWDRHDGLVAQSDTKQKLEAMLAAVGVKREGRDE